MREIAMFADFSCVLKSVNMLTMLLKSINVWVHMPTLLCVKLSHLSEADIVLI